MIFSSRPRPGRRIICPLVVLLWIGVAPAPVCSQAPEVVVQVTDATTGQPVAGAQIRIARATRATDATGSATLPAAAGEIAKVTRLGYAPQTLRIPEDSRGSAIVVRLEPRPIEAEGVQVEAKRGPRTPSLRQFYARAERGTGAFITREDIKRSLPRRLSDLFRQVPGVRIQPTTEGDKLEMAGAVPALYRGIGMEEGECPVQFYLEGVHVQPIRPVIVASDIRPDEVEGIEVYRRIS